MEKELLQALKDLVVLIKAGVSVETIIETKGGCLDAAISAIAKTEGKE
uniref:Uncharacterized protein n=1 Tax=viral metagenome TaxID=1070528 RepID=A0A6H2A5D5_9ZZZZ